MSPVHGDVLDPAFLEQLRAAALVGTDRRPPPGFPAPTDEPAEVALTAAAVAGLALRAGALSAEITAWPGLEVGPAAEDETLPAASEQASQLLDLILSGNVGPAVSGQQLFEHWIAECARANQRLPERLLLPVLTRLTSPGHADRERVLPVLGARGHWLAELQDKWAWARANPSMTRGDHDDGDVAESPTMLSESDWALVDTVDQVRVLGELRRVDADAARSLLESTWSTHSAKERAALLKTLRAGLGPGDDAFLEAALDDRSKMVRLEARRLLAALPESAFAERMVQRLQPLISQTGRLRKKVSIDYPPEPDDAGIRDGLADGRPNDISPRTHALKVIVASVPLEVWVPLLGGSVASAARFLGTQAEILPDVVAAVQTQQNVDWAEAIFDECQEDGLVSMLPSAKRAAHAAKHISAADWPVVRSALAPLDTPWPLDIGDAVLKRLLKTKDPQKQENQLNSIRYVLARGLDVSAVPKLEQLLGKFSFDDPAHRTIRNIIQTLTTRQAISEAFQ